MRNLLTLFALATVVTLAVMPFAVIAPDVAGAIGVVTFISILLTLTGARAH